MRFLGRKTTIIFLYYLALILSMFFIFSSGSLNLMGRIVFGGMVLFPAFFNLRIIPFALFVLFGISSNSIFPILPTEEYYYVLIFLFMLFFKQKQKWFTEYIVVFVFFLISDSLHLDVGNKHFLWMIIAILISGYFVSNEDIDNISFGFVIVSFFLSLEYLLFRDSFAQQFGRSSLNLERSSWMNPNVFGAAIALGGSLSVGILSKTIQICKKSFYRLLCILTVIMSLLVLVLNASRGAIVTFTVASVFYIIASKELKTITKIVVLFCAVAFFFFVLVSDYASLLLYRMQEDEDVMTMTGRTEIWTEYLNYYVSNENIVEMLLGIGYSHMLEVMPRHMSTHNDYVTSLIAYGLIGFVVFIILFLKPISKIPKKEKLSVLGLFVPIFLESIVVEPLFRGNLLFLVYYFFIIAYISRLRYNERIQ